MLEANGVLYRCNKCNVEFVIDESNCKDGMECPRCGGPVVWEGFGTVGAYTGDEPAQQPLLTIELETETSVPKVFYKGKEITNKVNVYLDWDRDTDTFGGLTYAIEHYEKGNGYPTLNRIERRVKGHAD